MVKQSPCTPPRQGLSNGTKNLTGRHMVQEISTTPGRCFSSVFPFVVSPLLERSSTGGFGCFCLPLSNYIHLVISLVGFTTASTASTVRSRGHLGFLHSCFGSSAPELAALEVHKKVVGRGGTFKTFLAERLVTSLEEILWERPSFGWCDPLRQEALVEGPLQRHRPKECACRFWGASSPKKWRKPKGISVGCAYSGVRANGRSRCRRRLRPLMAEEMGKTEGWGIFDRLKSLPYVMAVNGDLKRTTCKTSLQTEIDEEDSDVQEFPEPQRQQGDRLSKDLNRKQNEYGERGEVPEHTKYDGALSNRDLLNRLQAAAVGIRDFEELNLTQFLGEVKDKRVRVKKSTADNTTKSKAEEPSEKKLSFLKKASTNSTSKAILKAASKVRKGIIVKESEARENLAFSDTYLEKAFGLSTIAPVSEKPNASITAKRSANVTDDRPTRKPLKAKTLTTKQSVFLSTGDEVKPAKKEARQRELGWDGSDEKLPIKKKAKLSAKSIINQRIRVLPHEIRVLPEAALAEVMSAKEEQEVADAEMPKLIDEIRGMEHNENFSDLPSDAIERWIAAHAKNLLSAFDFHCTVVKHTLPLTASKVDP